MMRNRRCTADAGPGHVGDVHRHAPEPDVFEQPQAASEEHGHKVHPDLVDEPGSEVLWHTFAPPVIATSASPATSIASRRAPSMPSVTKV